MENIAEDFNVAAIADIVISLNQSEDERRRGLIRLHVVGNRLGESGDTFEAKCSWRTSKISPAIESKDLG